MVCAGDGRRSEEVLALGREGGVGCWRWCARRGAFFLCLCKERIKESTPRSSRPSRYAAGVRVAGGNFGTAHSCADPKRRTSLCGALRVCPPPPPLRKGASRARQKLQRQSAQRRAPAVVRAFAFALRAPLKAWQAGRVKPAGRRTRMCAVSGRGRRPLPEIPGPIADPERTARRARRQGCVSLILSLHKQRKNAPRRARHD